MYTFFFSSRRRHTRLQGDWSSDVCSSDLPSERLQYLLRNAEVKLVLTQPWLDSRLAWPDHVQRLCVDDVTFAGLDDGPLRSEERRVGRERRWGRTRGDEETTGADSGHTRQ